ncbi:NAD(+) diphosphatase [Primorskyibacter sp. S187A]|uniref:NAD(+) diphosphatase n=1 Tax=Primorskyibacter sp. S187A TaxID=3415130 RepID=UPI003C7CB86D
MRHAETVTFGGSGLDRAAQLRSDVAAVAANPTSVTILLWRGKPLICHDALVRLTMDHPVLAEAGAPILLGCDDTGAILAHELAHWVPEELDEAQLNQFLDPTLQVHPDLPEDHVFAELRSIMTQLTPRDAELAATAKAIFGWHESHRFCAKCGAASDMIMAGWERQCPVCSAKHFPRTDPVVIMLITHGNAVLMGRSPGWPDGMYSLLAGFVEPGETLEAAVRRETFEETGVEVGAVSYLASQPWPFPASLMFGCRGEAASRAIKIDPNEIEDAFWVSREEMAEAFAGTHPKLKPARKGAIAHFLLRNWLADTLD